MAVVSVWHRGHCGNVYLHLWLRIYDFAVMATSKLVTIFSVFFCGVMLLSKSNVEEDSLTGANVELLSPYYMGISRLTWIHHMMSSCAFAFNYACAQTIL